MKSIFFTMTNMASPNNANYLELGLKHRGLKQFCILIGGLPLNTDWVTIQNNAHSTHTYSKAISALMEVWSIYHKSDGNPSLSLEILTDTGVYQPTYNPVFGQELESFSQNSRLIQSGMNTMQSMFVLESIFGGSTMQKVVNGVVIEEAIFYNSNHNY